MLSYILPFINLKYSPINPYQDNLEGILMSDKCLSTEFGEKLKSAERFISGSLKKSNSNKNDDRKIGAITEKNSNYGSNEILKIKYRGSKEEKAMIPDYVHAIISYLKSFERAKNDFSDRVPGKFVHIFPASYMGGVLGFTYLGDTFMGLRDDLTGETKKMVDIHESIHTNDEYETRIITDWIMSEEKNLY